jgi:rhodanese-related sulfurtransferase
MSVAATAFMALDSTTPAYSAAAVKVENKALVDAIQGAQADAKAGRYAEALAKAKTADAIQGKPAQLTRDIHQMIVAYAVQARSYNDALAQLDKMIASNDCTAVDANGDGTRKKMGVIPNAILLPDTDVFDAKQLPSDKSRQLVFYCANTHCGASHEAAGKALTAGYKNVKVLPAGIAGWVKAGKKTQVSVKETAPKTYQLKIEGGDRAGNAVPMQGEKRVFLVGRGPWHGDDQQVANDVVVSETEKGISRRAARLHRVSGNFELEALDQSEALVVARPDGQRLRPALAASGRVPVQPGDVIEFTDGAKTVLTVKLEEA